MRRLLLITALALSAHADPIRIAIIDTGIDSSHQALKSHLCKSPGESGRDSQNRDKATNGVDDDANGFIDDVHGWNFSKDSNDLSDDHGHGTHIAGLITKFAGKASHCFVILKYYDPDNSGQDNLRHTVEAFKMALAMHVDFINYSGGGILKSAIEEAVIREALAAGIIIVAAAGNEGSDINVHRFYPAAYDSRIVSVGALDDNGTPLHMSNYSKPENPVIKVEMEHGYNVFSTLPHGQFGLMTGTSQATATMTGKLVERMGYIRSDKYANILYTHRLHDK